MTVFTRPAEQTALLAAIHHEPDDDTSRLVYADWLDEEAGDLTPRGEFIRVQVELARLPLKPRKHHDRCKEQRPYAGCELCEWSITIFDIDIALRARERDLLARHEAEWRCPNPCLKCGGNGHVYPPVRQYDAATYTHRDKFGCPTCHGLGRVGTLASIRTRAEVEAARRTPRGCCSRHADNQACDCLERAVTVTWSRGFAVIECPVAWWCEAGARICPDCHGKWEAVNKGSFRKQCNTCDDGGMVPDYPHARGCWEEQGYCEVRLTDREPNGLYWNDEDVEPTGEPDNLPHPLFLVLREMMDLRERAMCVGDRECCFRTPEAAHLALSRACGIWARGLAMGGRERERV